MQRLYSTFPDRGPGIGLVCLRLGTSISLFHYFFLRHLAGRGASEAHVIAPLIAALAGILILAGLWTPIAGTVIAFAELWIGFAHRGDPWVHILLAALGASLAMLGPGAWSLDARIFGRKRFDLTPLK